MAFSDEKLKVDLSRYNDPLPLSNKLKRAVWNNVWALFFRTSPRRCFGWRRRLLRAFGAKIAENVNVYPTAKIWAPWNLEMHEYSCLAQDVDCYCMAPIKIGAHAVVSQYAYLCSGSHDISDPHMGLIFSPITIGEGAWVCAAAFVGPGVTIGEGAVVGARASIFKNVAPWTVVGGNPAKFIKHRVLDIDKKVAV